ncbi:LGFP repeat-containing protein [Nonomuraea sp. NPDC050328]|uniref:LGFP repeat-containing protein n=1 Tax=Nonomuraea sp. NPDC050328 TaxID=3364361 RepID=UPI0037B29D58
MRRALAMGMAAVASVAGMITAPAASAATSACSIQPYGLIGDYWRSLGGEDSIIDCPTGVEYSIPNRNGRRQNFEDGQIAWSPDQGGRMIVAAYAAKVNGRRAVVFRWGPSTPFTYDYWKISVRTSDGSLNRTGNVDNQPSSHGKFVVYPAAAGVKVSFTVMGCDDLRLNPCRQGWTLWVSATSN